MKRHIIILALCAAVAACANPDSGRPVIGIAATHSSTSSSVGDSYIEAVRNAGGVPVIIPFTTDSLAVEANLDLIDGLLMPGGEDVNPARYGHEAIPELGKVNDPRDTFDLMLIRCAVRRSIPVLGICRGEQAINVALGGTLWQDLPSQQP